MSTPEPSTAELWAGLLAWLATFDGGDKAVRRINLVDNPAGRGLVATEDVKPNAALISIPRDALLNRLTLAPLYPLNITDQLDSTKLLSLHLALQFTQHLRSPRPPSPASPRSPTRSPTAASHKPPPAARDRWWPFLASLPRAFPTVPLTWHVESLTVEEIRTEYGVADGDVSLSEWEAGEGGKEGAAGRRRRGELLRRLPASVERRAEDVKRRFMEDWKEVNRVWSAHLATHPSDPPLCFFDFLLGWLNVNSRCVYFKLGKKHDDNLTLAPVIDMINHTDNIQTRPLQTPLNGLSFSSPAHGSTDPPLKEGTELTFSYGAHEDAMLLTEYGFTLAVNPFNNVELDGLVEELFERKGEEGRVKRQVLEEEGYWGEMTLQPLPAPASASWRVLAALRLLHLPLPRSTLANPCALDASLAPWRAVLAGERETLSPANEASVRESVRNLCERVAADADAGLEACEEMRERWAREAGGVEVGLREGAGMVEGIWRSEGEAAREVERCTVE